MDVAICIRSYTFAYVKNKVCQTTEISPVMVMGLATLTDTASILDAVKEAKEKIIIALLTRLTARYNT